jgi:hypothetical protein
MLGSLKRNHRNNGFYCDNNGRVKSGCNRRGVVPVLLTCTPIRTASCDSDKTKDMAPSQQVSKTRPEETVTRPFSFGFRGGRRANASCRYRSARTYRFGLALKAKFRHKGRIQAYVDRWSVTAGPVPSQPVVLAECSAITTGSTTRGGGIVEGVSLRRSRSVRHCSLLQEVPSESRFTANRNRRQPWD